MPRYVHMEFSQFQKEELAGEEIIRVGLALADGSIDDKALLNWIPD
ncbi:MAG: hypothetical protein VB055_04345 [Oscillospiraceae bacterium]|nr:hypothetical protein [Oscillospiraceae bacterium]